MMVSHLPTITLLLAFTPLSAAMVYSDGRGDIRISYANGDFGKSYSIDPEALVDGLPAGPGPDDVTFESSMLLIFIPDTPLARPPGVEFDFFGNTEGEPLWLIPEAQEFDRPWLGFSSETPTVDHVNGVGRSCHFARAGWQHPPCFRSRR